jgi:predicted ATP-grasp superfamily ATP-dependent carboligase
MARILITDGDSRSALAATRSLGRRGHEVFTAATTATSLSGVSRHSRAAFRYPDPAVDSAGFVDAIANLAAQHRFDVVIPMTEITTLLLTGERDRLPAGCRLPFPSQEIIARASDKAAMVELARECGVPIPATVTVNSLEEARAVAPKLSYPAVIKPGRSRVRAAGGWISTGVGYASDSGELLRRLEALDPAVFPVLLQERIAGEGVGVFACYDRGKALALFAHRRIREKPPSGGVSVLRESAPLDPAAAEHANRLLQALGWHGVAMVEFKRDDRDGSLRLMEINARFWGSLQLAIDAGVDFPAMLAELALGGVVQPVDGYAQGVRSRWFWGDFDVLLAVLFRSRRQLDLPKSYPGRLRSLFDFLRLWGRNLNYEVERWDDLRPGWLEARRWLFGR